MDGDRPITREFPMPPPIIQGMLRELQVAAQHPPESTEELRQLEEMPRPWDPPTCPSETQRYLWRWLDQVALWINDEHTWRLDRIIPICWKEHPHIAHELATVACLRVNASYAYVPDPLEDWHKYTLPMFLDRIAQRAGNGGCPPDRHQPSPGEQRHARLREVQR